MLRYTTNGAGNGGNPAAGPVVEPVVSNLDPVPNLPGEILGEISSGGYCQLIEIFQARCDSLVAAGDWRVRTLDRDRFRRFGPVTLGPILGVLGLKIIAVEDPEQMAKMAHRLTPAKFRRWLTHASDGVPAARKRPRNSYTFARDPEFARAARMLQLERMSPAARRRLAKRAAAARWGKAAQMRHVENGKATKPEPVVRRSVIRAAAGVHAVMAKA